MSSRLNIQSAYENLFQQVKNAYGRGKQPDHPEEDDPVWRRGCRACFLANLSGETVLEIGTGAGHDFRAFQQREYQIIGLDLSFEWLQTLNTDSGSRPLINGNTLWLPFSPASFDGLFTQYTLLHIPHYLLYPVFSEWNRVLQPDGLLFISFIEHKLYAERTVLSWRSIPGNTCTLYFQKPFHVKHIIDTTGFSLIMHGRERPRTHPGPEDGDTHVHQFLLRKTNHGEPIQFN